MLRFDRIFFKSLPIIRINTGARVSGMLKVDEFTERAGDLRSKQRVTIQVRMRVKMRSKCH